MTKILVVDDEKIVLDGWVNELKETGFETVGLGHPEEAVDAAQDAAQDGHPFDLAVLDVRFDNVASGSRYHRSNPLALSEDLRNITKGIPIIMVTGNPASQKPSARRAALESGGAVVYLDKPLDPEDVVSQVKALVKLVASFPNDERIAFESQVFHFGINAPGSSGFMFDAQEGTLKKQDGTDVNIGRRVSRVLCLLLKARGKVVLKETFRRPWEEGGADVPKATETNDYVAQAMTKLRSSLGVSVEDGVIEFFANAGREGGYKMNCRLL